MDVAAVNALINADTKLTAAEKTDIIENAFELGLHKTFIVTLEFSHGQYTEYQGFDGATGEVGSRATYAFPDDHTLVIEEPCCGISTFDVTPAQLITAIVTEHGVHESPYADSLVRAIVRA